MRVWPAGCLAILLSACGQESGPSLDGEARKSDAEPNMNRLATEISPYLLQHAENPVDWYPWGEEAFAAAKKRNVPIFLSIGYSTCHWCHVMNRESFQDPDIAEYLNEHFIPIKVDREQRPDVDQVYMTFVQATTGSGGWPLNVWLTPDLAPLVGGTYFPPKDAYGRPGFPSILRQIAQAWEEDEEGLREQASETTRRLRVYAASEGGGGDLPNAGILDGAREQLAQRFDTTHGGFGAAPKFPRVSELLFLLAEARRDDLPAETRQQALHMATTTLEAISRGGIRDHIGGGFHRYSVDEFWHIPHYEKMLYDQAQGVIALLEAHSLSPNPLFETAVRDTLAYVRRDLTAPGGGFYSAEDADSLAAPDADHKTEGAFYVWTQPELDKLLGEDAPLFHAVYGVEKKGNAPSGSDPHGELRGTNTLIRRLSNAEAAERFDLDPDTVAKRLNQARDILLEARSQRPRPHLDDKILAAWNGMMIAAYARAHRVLGDPAYLEAAERAAAFLDARLRDPDSGAPLRDWREGEAGGPGFASDHAHWIDGLLELYQAGHDPRHLQTALELQAHQDRQFWDDKQNGYFETREDAPNLLFRMKETHDGAEPSANSVSAINLARLGHLLADPAYETRARDTVASLGDNLSGQPLSLPLALVALERVRSPGRQLVIVGQPDHPDTRAMMEVANEHADPETLLVHIANKNDHEFFAAHADFFQPLDPEQGAPAAYLCENFVCDLPVDKAEDLRKLLTR